MNQRLVFEGFLDLEILDDWEDVTENEVIALSKNAGFGAVNITILNKESPLVGEHENKELIESFLNQDHFRGSEKVKINEINGKVAICECKDSGLKEYWYVYSTSSVKRAIIATYHVSLKEKAKQETEEAINMI